MAVPLLGRYAVCSKRMIAVCSKRYAVCALCRLPPTAYRLPPTAYRLPPTAYRLPPTAYRLLPTAYLRPNAARAVTGSISVNATTAPIPTDASRIDRGEPASRISTPPAMMPAAKPQSQP